MKSARTDTITSQQTPIELYSNDSCSWMISDSPHDASPFPMVCDDQKLRFVFDDFVEGGALRSGSAPKLFSRHYFGLVAQYAAIGFIDGVLPNVMYPFLQNYLNLPGAQTTTAFLLVQMPWSFKVFYGVVSDCFPIWGYRRRPYILSGWIFALSMLLIMSFTPKCKPYFTNPDYRDVKPEDYTPEIIATINYEATDTGTAHIIPMMGCAFGYLLSDVSADGMVVELAQREPYDERGNSQTVIYTTRTIFNMLAYILVAFCFNGEEYGGDFSFSLSFPMLMFIVTIIIMPIVPITWFFLHEEKNAIALDFSHYMYTFWDVIQTRAVYQYLAYQFFSGTLSSFTFMSKSPVMRNWVEVLPIQEKVGGLLSTGMYATSIYFAGNYGRSWDWRRTAVVTSFGYVVLDVFVKLLTIWDNVRSPYLWLGITVLEQIPLGVKFIVGSFIIVELATEGHEGALYGLFTTVHNLTTPFSATIARNVDSMFNLTTERIQNDTYGVRRDMTISVVIMWTANLCSLFFLVMLPQQKEQTRAMKQMGGSSYVMGAITVSYLIFALLWTTTTSILSIFPSTSCLAITGGFGCHSSHVKP
ncbi:hypothetical protein F442_13907 [Plasmopara halstedii]|uniref:Transmembrane protein n=1 Tax=Plasmopara halstedii TaxID=4781 RepID=A0A0P1AXX9_PLAHL|nr:hypothetical protein F442_13907 [Plasmopara halstedii]CEG46314.1 hypothetical protein F442_13907 [Plasmopara halstedii]|eukprot:XP_024582683.1 hypothetical protein F442_13907 [Plasmopara halstedii]